MAAMMLLRSTLLAFVALFIASVGFSQTRSQSVAPPFYPADPIALADSVNHYLALGAAGASDLSGQQIVALIAPHAGYQFSGRTAGLAYAAVQRRNYKRIFILGPSHAANFSGAAFPSGATWVTPLGPLPIDTAVERLMRSQLPFLATNDSAFAGEHSIEVQLPFIQKSVGEVKIVPILFGNMDFQQERVLATLIRRITEVSSEPALVIASTDMTHYTTASVASNRDWQTSQRIVEGNVDAIYAQAAAGDPAFCGNGAVITAMLVGEQTGASARVLGYATTATTTKDTSRVVGYGAFAIAKPYPPDVISQADRSTLLKAARAVLQSTVANTTPNLPSASSERLRQRQGAFVTLMKGDEVRGCIGFRSDKQDIFQSVVQSAKFAAARDSRFPAVADTELSKIKIEVSAISDLRRVRSIDEITLGQDGLYIRYGDKSGLLLPQVARQYNWTMEEYLKQVCAKADLEPSILTTQGVELYRFTDEVFSE
jgi:AmmeMemoRadiSam system protein B/AmmeMemoRadiSam system protein A